VRIRYPVMLVSTGLALALVPAGAAIAKRTATPAAELDVFAYQTAPGVAAEMEVDVLTSATQPTAALTIYAPAGYRAALPRPGAKVGDALALRFRGASGTVRGQGALVADDPAKHDADQCALGTHAGVWVISTIVASQPLVIPIYVDPASAELAPRVAYQLKVCLDAATAAGLTLEELDIDLPKVFTNPASPNAYVWRALVTPYGAGNVADPTKDVELQSLLPLPHRLSLAARYDAKRRNVTLWGSHAITGRLKPAGFAVHVEAANKPSVSALKPFARARTDRSGRFSITKRLRRTTYFYAYINFYYVTQCEPTLGTAPCASETLAPPPGAFAAIKLK
jgi:hypothetical protein